MSKPRSGRLHYKGPFDHKPLFIPGGGPYAPTRNEDGPIGNGGPIRL